MQEYPGKFIVLEGSDGSGKGTQFKLLSERLRAVGHEVKLFDFPRYDQTSSHFVKRYLNGDYGPASEINPYTASMFFALDRYEASAEIKQALEAGKIVLSNRYAGSNMAHQGSKFADETEQRGFFVWADSLEFSLLGIPRPDINLFLRVPADISFELIAKKNRRNYTDKSHDQHEADIEHLRKSVATYDLLSKLFPKDFVAIECSENGRLMSVPDINNKIWEQIQPLLPATPPNKGHKVVVQLDKPPQPAAEKAEKAASPVAQGDRMEIKLTRISMLALIRLETAPNIFVDVQQVWGEAEAELEYYIPPGLSAALGKSYNDDMKKIAKLQRQMRKSLQRYLEQQKVSHPKAHLLLKSAIPMAALSTARVSGESSALTKLVSELETSLLPEFKAVAQRIRNVVKPQGKSTTTGVKNSHINSLLKPDELSNNLSSSVEPLNLLDFWPRSEFSLLADGIYPYTDLGREEISQNLEHWSYERKENTLRTMLLDPTSRVLEQVKYRWDTVSDSLSLSEAVRRGLNELQTQAPTPRYGYEVPELLEQAGLENEFVECFDTSLRLFSQLQAAGEDAESAYAVLLGHKLRWQFSVSAKDLARQITSHRGQSDYGDLLSAIREKVMEVHPILGTSLNQLAEIRLKQPDPNVPFKRKRNRRRSRKSPS
jgi:dTMP kinase